MESKNKLEKSELANYQPKTLQTPEANPAPRVMNLYIIRHGETVWNKEDPHRLQGRTDVALSAEGIKQAKKIAERLSSESIALIYSSPLKRAKHTAKEIAKHHKGIKVMEDSDIIELDFGHFDGLNSDEIRAKYPEDWEKREADKWDFRIGEGESYSDLDVRAKRFLNKVMGERKDCLVVAHGTMNKIILMRLLGKSHDEINKHHYGNTSLSVFEINSKGEVKTLLFNSIDHLKK
ncbi:MAG: histidine phosphatase family protein [archaeon]